MASLKQFNNFTQLMSRIGETYKFTDYEGEIISGIMSEVTPWQMKKVQNPIDIVRKCVAQNDNDHVLNFVHVDDDNIVAMDGHRLVFLERGDDHVELNKGLYKADDMLKITVSNTEVQYPYYQELIPNSFDHNLDFDLEKDCKIKQENGVRYMHVDGMLKFHVDHFIQMVNGSPKLTIHFNDSKEPSLCEILTDEFPTLHRFLMTMDGLDE